MGGNNASHLKTGQVYLMASVKKYKTAKGHAWRVQYRSPDGRSRTKQGFATKAAAQAWADKNAVYMHNQDWIDPNAGKVTVGELGPRWLAMRSHLKPSTVAWQKHVWASGVKPYWEDVAVGSIKPSHVQEWVAVFGMSASWVRHCHSCLAQILDLAVSDRLIRRNPARGVKLPRREQTVKVYLTMQQLQAFAKECGDREDLILLLGTSGLRWGEAIALRPCDLDPLRNRISINRNAVKVDGDVVVGSPKNHELRSVAVAGYVMDLLVKRAASLAPDDLLWRGRRGGWLTSPGHRSWFTHALERAQGADASFPRITPHGLRHVAAGLLVQSGANVKIVQRQLGHKSAALTLDRYAELFDDGLDSVASALDAGFSDVVGLSCDPTEKQG